MTKKVIIIGCAGFGTTIITEALKSSEHEAVFIEEVKTNPAFEPEPINITSHRHLVEIDIDPRIYLDPPKSKYIPNRKKK